MSFKNPKVPVHDYLMTIHYALCHGPVQNVSRVWIKDTLAYPYEGQDPTPEENALLALSLNNSLSGSPVPSVKTVNLALSDLFGGDKKEGGVYGDMDVLHGAVDQLPTPEMAARYGGANTEIPSFAGVASLFFRGANARARRTMISVQIDGIGKMLGFRWGTNNPFLPPVAAQVTRRPDVFSLMREGSTGRSWLMIPSLDPKLPPDANPAAIVAEVITHAEVGAGVSQLMIDKQSVIDCAKTLEIEGLGMSLAWHRGDDSANDFLSEVMDHVNGVGYVEPTTGLYTMRLIRKAGTLGAASETDIHLTDENCSIKSVHHRTWSETTGEIVAEYTSPIDEETKSVIVQDLSNAAMNNGVLKSDKRSYYGFRNAKAAIKAATRDLLQECSPLLSGDLVALRSSAAGTLRPGQTFLLSSDAHGIHGVRCRVSQIDFGDSDDRTLQIDFMEDVFSKEGHFGFVAPEVAEPYGSLAADGDRSQIMWTPAPLMIRAGRATASDLDGKAPMLLPLAASRRDNTMTPFELLAPEGRDFDMSVPSQHDDANRAHGEILPHYLLGFELEVIDLPEKNSSWLLDTYVAPQAVTVLPAAALTRASSIDPVKVGDVLMFAQRNPAWNYYQRGWINWYKPGVLPIDLRAGKLTQHLHVLRKNYGDVDHLPLPGQGNIGYLRPLDENIQEPTVAQAIGTYGEEWAMVTAVASNGAITLQRGLFDTTPAPIQKNTIVIRVMNWTSGEDAPSIVEDGTATFAGRAKPYYINAKSPRSDSDAVDFEAFILERFPTVRNTGENVARHLRPTRPANFRASGYAAFAPVRMDGEAPVDLSVSWATRNRLLEDASPPAWTDLSVMPEPGSKCRVTVLAFTQPSDPTIFDWPSVVSHSQEIEAGAGTSATIPATAFASGTHFLVLADGVLDGAVSLQPAYIYVTRNAVAIVDPAGGWGLDYGLSFGGVS